MPLEPLKKKRRIEEMTGEQPGFFRRTWDNAMNAIDKYWVNPLLPKGAGNVQAEEGAPTNENLDNMGRKVSPTDKYVEDLKKWRLFRR